MIINFITYYVFVTPFGYLFAFHIGQNWHFQKKGVDQAFGVQGLWIGFLIGLGHQIIAYLTLIQRTDWKKVIQSVRARQLVEENGLPAVMVNTHHSSFCSSLDNRSDYYF